MRTREGRAKVFGTLLSIGGAMVLTLYKGPQINVWATHVNLLKHHVHHVSPSHHALGSFLAVASCFSYATWLIIQVISLSQFLFFLFFFFKKKSTYIPKVTSYEISNSTLPLQCEQAKLGERYPLHYSSTALICASATAQATVYATCMEKSWSAWKLGWNIRLLTVAFAVLIPKQCFFLSLLFYF